MFTLSPSTKTESQTGYGGKSYVEQGRRFGESASVPVSEAHSYLAGSSYTGGGGFSNGGYGASYSASGSGSGGSYGALKTKTKTKPKTGKYSGGNLATLFKPKFKTVFRFDVSKSGIPKFPKESAHFRLWKHSSFSNECRHALLLLRRL